MKSREFSGAAALDVRGLHVSYGPGAPAVVDVDLEVGPGEVVALLGANGAGKSSTLLALAGAVRPTKGVVSLFGRQTSAPLHVRARHGLALLSEERSVFTGLTVRDNLRLGRGRPERALDLFPELGAHLDRPAGLLSGGQQQMLALGRVLAGRPRILLADELSLGLAPIIVLRLLEAVRRAADDGLAVVLVEQHVKLALDVADRAYVLRHGHVIFCGPATDLSGDADRLAGMYLTHDSKEARHD